MGKQVYDGTQFIREGKEGLETARAGADGKPGEWSKANLGEAWEKDAKELLKAGGKEVKEEDAKAEPKRESAPAYGNKTL